MKILNISTIQKASDGFYFVAMTDGSTAVIPEDSKIIKEYKAQDEKNKKRSL